MNAENTIKAMEETLRPHHGQMELDNDVELQFDGDNARPHTSRAYRNYLNDNNINHIGFGGHPVNSPGGKPHQ
jgi:hypothetical protein